MRGCTRGDGGSRRFGYRDPRARDRRAARPDSWVQRFQLRRYRERARGDQGQPALPLPVEGRPRGGADRPLRRALRRSTRRHRAGRARGTRRARRLRRALSWRAARTTACACAASSRASTRRFPADARCADPDSSAPTRRGWSRSWIAAVWTAALPSRALSVDTARLVLSSLEGAMLVARANGDISRFDSTARSLITSICSAA